MRDSLSRMLTLQAVRFIPESVRHLPEKAPAHMNRGFSLYNSSVSLQIISFDSKNPSGVSIILLPLIFSSL